MLAAISIGARGFKCFLFTDFGQTPVVSPKVWRDVRGNLENVTLIQDGDNRTCIPLPPDGDTYFCIQTGRLNSCSSGRSKRCHTDLISHTRSAIRQLQRCSRTGSMHFKAKQVYSEEPRPGVFIVNKKWVHLTLLTDVSVNRTDVTSSCCMYPARPSKTIPCCVRQLLINPWEPKQLNRMVWHPRNKRAGGVLI